MTEHVARRRTAAGAWVVLTLAVLASLLPARPAAAAPTPLVGTFRLAAGACSGSAVSGSWFRMILPSGSPTGPYLSNNDSRCSDQSYTPLAPGADGGLRSGSFQPGPSPAFDANGNGLARRITAPATFYGAGFATSTSSVDPQTKTGVRAPMVSVTGSTLSADLRSFSAAWNNQYFNQGSPKPNGSYPGNTRPATGTFDARAGAFTLTWTSQIVGGAFDKFTGQWHLQGTFVPATTATRAGAPAGSAAAPAKTSQAAPAAAPVTGQTAAAQPTASTATTAAPVTGAAPVVAQPAAVTRTTTHTSWQASPWLIALAVALALLGFGALAALQRALSRKAGQA